VSGSMHGFPLETTKALMRKLLGGLRPVDQFNVVLFAGRSLTMSPDGSLAASPENIAQATQLLDGQQGGGGTELLAGLRASYQIPRRDRNVSRTVVVVTDGFVGVEHETFRFIRERLDQANLFAFGIGSSVNRGLIEGMARAGVGEPFVVLRPEKAPAEAERFQAYIEQPVLTQVSVSFHGFSAVELAPEKLPDLMARRPLVLFGKYRGPAGGRIDITGATGTGRFHQTVQVKSENVRNDNAALRWLWARKRVALLDDERQMGGSKTAEADITRLGLEHNLLTAFTSFVAIDSQVVNQGGKATTVKQPLPLPEGVSDLAVGNVAYKAVAGMGVGASGPSRRASKPFAELLGGGATTTLDLELATPSFQRIPPPAPAAAEAKVGRKPAAPVRAEPGRAAEVVGQTSVTDAQPLAEQVMALFLRSACARPAGVMRLRLSVDAGGKVLALKLLEGDAHTLRCLQRALLQLQTATRAHGAATGTVDLRLTTPPPPLPSR
jgi:hypothetical protein